MKFVIYKLESIVSLKRRWCHNKVQPIKRAPVGGGRVWLSFNYDGDIRRKIRNYDTNLIVA